MHRLYRKLCCVLAQSTAIVDNWSFALWITGFGRANLAGQEKKMKESDGAFWLYLRF